MTAPAPRPAFTSIADQNKAVVDELVATAQKLIATNGEEFAAAMFSFALDCDHPRAIQIAVFAILELARDRK